MIISIRKMAERTDLSLARRTTKTQESLKENLAEWRKAKQQTAEQLKAARLRTPIRNTPSFSNAKSLNVLSSRREVISKRRSLRKSKENINSQKSLNMEANTADKPCSAQKRNAINTSKNLKRTSGVVILRERLDLWRAEKSKSESQRKCSKPQFKVQKLSNEHDYFKTNPSSTSKLVKEKPLHAKCRKSLSADPSRKTLTNRRMYSKKPQATACPSKPAKKIVANSKERAISDINDMNILKTPGPIKTQMPYMDKSLSLRERLELWRKEKGKTPAVPKTPATLRRKSTLPAKDKSKQQAMVMGSLDSLQVLEHFDTMGCDAANKESTPEEIKIRLQSCLEIISEEQICFDSIASELDDIQKAHKSVLQCAEYWVCRAKIAEHENDHGRVVCMFEQALVFNAEPESLIKDAVAAYSKKMKGTEEPADECFEEEQHSHTGSGHSVTDSPIRAVRLQHNIPSGNVKYYSPNNSSVVKYSVKKATPFKSRLKSCERLVATPVRRSIRVERRSVNYPMMLQEQGFAVRHLDELPEDIRNEVVFKPNFAVQAELNEAWRDMWEGDL